MDRTSNASNASIEMTPLSNHYPEATSPPRTPPRSSQRHGGPTQGLQSTQTPPRAHLAHGNRSSGQSFPPIIQDQPEAYRVLNAMEHGNRAALPENAQPRKINWISTTALTATGAAMVAVAYYVRTYQISFDKKNAEIPSISLMGVGALLGFSGFVQTLRPCAPGLVNSYNNALTNTVGCMLSACSN